MIWKLLFRWIGNLWKTRRPIPQGVKFDKPDKRSVAKMKTYIEDGKIIFPGNLVFDPEEFRQFRRDHPEYCQRSGDRRYTVKDHPAVGGVSVVGISPAGIKGPGPPEGLIEFLSREDEKK